MVLGSRDDGYFRNPFTFAFIIILQSKFGEVLWCLSSISFGSPFVFFPHIWTVEKLSVESDCLRRLCESRGIISTNPILHRC